MNRFSFSNIMKSIPRRLTFEEKVTKAKTDMYGWLREYFGERSWGNYTRGYGTKYPSDEKYPSLETYHTPKKQEPNGARSEFAIAIFLGDNEYIFNASINEIGKSGLNCQAVSMRRVVGEASLRSELVASLGEFNKETFELIIKKILEREFKEAPKTTKYFHDAYAEEGPRPPHREV